MSNTILDSSSNALTVTRAGNVAQGSFSPYVQVQELTNGWSTYFQGLGGYLLFPSSANFNFVSGDVTLEAWINVPALPGSGIIQYLCGTHSASGDGKTACYLYSDGRLAIGKVGTNEIVAPAGTIVAGVWTHVAFVREGSTTKIYRNGESVASSSTDVWSSGNSSFTVGYVGNYAPSSSITWKGYISNLRVVKGTAVYKNNFNPNMSTPLSEVDGTSLLTCNTSTIDNSVFNIISGKYGHAISVSGNASVSNSVVPFAGTYSVAFDGTGDYLTAASSSAFNFSSGNITLEAWVYASSIPSTMYLFGTHSGGVDYKTACYVYTNGRIAIGIIGSGEVSSGAGVITTGSWIHLAFVKNGSTTTIYKNGVSVVSSTSNMWSAVDSTFGIGFSSLGGTSQWNGYISNVRLVRGTALYTGTFTPPSSPLTAVSGTVLLTAQSATITDNSEYFTLPTKAPEISKVSAYNFTSGHWSAYFDGNGDSVSLASSSNFAFGTGDFTVEFWVNFNNTNNRQDLVWWSNGSTDRGGIVWNMTTGYLTYHVLPTVGNAINVEWSPVAGTWYHIALTRQTGVSRIFINGALQSPTYSDTKSYSNSTIWVAQDSSANSSYLNGYVSNLRIVKGRSLYASSFSQITTPLTVVPNTTLLTLNSNRFRDNVNNATITKNGNAAISSNTPFLTTATYTKTTNSGSGYFDGTGDSVSVPSNANLQFGTGDFTIEMWVYLTALPAIVGSLYDSRPASTNGAIPCLYISSTGSLRWYINTADRITGDNLPVGAWSHVAVCRSGTTTKMFLNGIQTGSSWTDSTNYTASATYIGAGFHNTASLTYFLSGYISDVNAIKGVALYTENFVPPPYRITHSESDLLLNFNNSSAADYVAKNNSEMVGTVTIDNSIKKFGAASFNFGTTGTNYFKFIDNPGLRFDSQDFTVEGWFRPASSGTRFFYQKGSSLTNGLMLAVSTNSVTFRSGGSDLTASVTLSSTEFTHVAFVRKGSLRSIFVNGSLVTTGRQSFTVDATNDVEIGATSIGAASCYYGHIDDLRVTKGVARYASAFVVPTVALSADANTKLLLAKDNYIKDHSASNRVVTVGTDAKEGDVNPHNIKPFDYTMAGNWSTYFDGTDDYLYVPSNSNLAFGTGDFTIEFWIYGETIPSGTTKVCLYDSRPASTNGTYPTIRFNGATFYYYANTADRITGSALSPHRWYHIAVCRSGTSTRMFLNGTQVGTTYSDSTNYLTGDTIIGAGYEATASLTAFFKGYISNLRVLKGSALYTANFTPSLIPLTAISSTALLTCQDSSLKDKSPNDLGVTYLGTRLDPMNPFVTIPTSYQSTYYAGSSRYLDVAANSSFNFGTGDFTIEFWMNTAGNASTTRSIIDRWNVTGTATERTILIRLYRTANDGILNNHLHFATMSGSTTRNIYANFNSFYNTWAHVVCMRSGTNFNIYINGTPSGTSNVSTGAAPVDHSDAINSSTIITRIAMEGGLLSNVRIVKGVAVYPTTGFASPTVPLDDITGTGLLTCRSTLTDESSTKSTITTTGTIDITQTSPFSYTQHYSMRTPGNWSTSFSGVSSSLALYSDPGLEFGTGDFSVEGWFYTQDMTRVRNLADQTLINLSNSQIRLYLDSSNGAMAYAIGGGSAVVTSTIPTERIWNHFALVRSGSNLGLFLNGNRIATATNSSNLTSTTNTFIGSNTELTGNFFGYMTNVRLTKGTAVYDPTQSTYTVPTTAFSSIQENQILGCGDYTIGMYSIKEANLTSSGDATPNSAEFPFAGTRSIGFDGTLDYLTVPYEKSSFDWYTTGEDFTLECWVKPTSLTSWSQNNVPVLIGNAVPTSATVYWAFGPAADGTVKFYYFNGGGITVSSTTTISAGSWSHIAMTKTSRGITLFVNGIASSTTAIAGTPQSVAATGLTIGQGNGSSINGYISNLRVVKGTALYTSSFTPPTQQLEVVYGTKLLTARYTTLKYTYANQVNMRKLGSARFHYQTPFFDNANWSIYFDGNRDVLRLGDNADFDLGLNGESFTYELWVNLLGYSWIGSIFGLTKGGESATWNATNGLQYALSFSSNTLYWQFWNGSSNVTLSAAATANGFAIKPYTWHHIAVTYDGTTTRLYVDSIPVASGTGTYAKPTTSNQTNMGTHPGGTTTITRYESNFRLTKGAVLYTTNVTVPTEAFPTKGANVI